MDSSLVCFFAIALLYLIPTNLQALSGLLRGRNFQLMDLLLLAGMLGGPVLFPAIQFTQYAPTSLALTFIGLAFPLHIFAWSCGCASANYKQLTAAIPRGWELLQTAAGVLGPMSLLVAAACAKQLFTPYGPPRNVLLAPVFLIGGQALLYLLVFNVIRTLQQMGASRIGRGQQPLEPRETETSTRENDLDPFLHRVFISKPMRIAPPLAVLMLLLAWVLLCAFAYRGRF